MKTKTLKGIALALCLFITAAEAVPLSTVIRNCKQDGKTWCPKVSYGKAMQTCLQANFKKLTPACKAVVTKLQAGERIKFF